MTRTPGQASDAAVEAACRALTEERYGPMIAPDGDDRDCARVAAAAATPIIRAEVVADVLAFLDSNRGGAHGGCYTSADDVRNAIADEFSIFAAGHATPPARDLKPAGHASGPLPLGPGA